jgi:hypothetical protein
VGRIPNSGIYLRRRIGLLMVAAVLVSVGITLASNAGHSGPRDLPRAATIAIHLPPGTPGAVTVTAPAPAPAPAPPPALVVRAAAPTGPAWRPVALVHGQPAAWVSERSGVTLLRFEQASVRLDLHAGSSDGGVVGWRYGDRISPSEIHHVIAAFNGGFKFTYPDVGFVSGGRVALPLKSGLASIVTYTDGTTDIGVWRAGLPSSRHSVYSVLQNQRLLVDRGEVAANASSCIAACWGETIKGLKSVARSGLGITANGQLLWAAGESLLPGELGRALVAAGAVRAIELDINPDWVAGYLYEHRHDGPLPVPVLARQIGIAGQLLEPYSRDFMTIVAR